jgi:hypothetical protein
MRTLVEFLFIEKPTTFALSQAFPVPYFFLKAMKQPPHIGRKKRGKGTDFIFENYARSDSINHS